MDFFALVFLALLAIPFGAAMLGYALRPHLDTWPRAVALPANRGGWCDEDEPTYYEPSRDYGHGINPSTGSLMMNAHVDMEGRGFGQGLD